MSDAQKIIDNLTREMPEHTPGPWKVTGQTVYNPDAKVGNIAFIYCKSTNDRKSFSDDEIGQANARLIAAAPDLLEACKISLIFTLALKGSMIDPTPEMIETVNEHITFLKQAIAKAKGVLK